MKELPNCPLPINKPGREGASPREARDLREEEEEKEEEELPSSFLGEGGLPGSFR